RAFLNTEDYARALQLVNKGLKDGSLRVPERAREDPFFRAGFRKGILEGAQLGLVSKRYPGQVLGIRVRDKDGKVWGDPEHPLFQARGPFSGKAEHTAWLRFNYDAEEGPTGHAAHYGIWQNVIVVVHYAFRKKDREDFATGKEVSRSFLERA